MNHLWIMVIVAGVSIGSAVVGAYIWYRVLLHIYNSSQ
jgi:hypothetical protein